MCLYSHDLAAQLDNKYLSVRSSSMSSPSQAVPSLSPDTFVQSACSWHGTCMGGFSHFNPLSSLETRSGSPSASTESTPPSHKSQEQHSGDLRTSPWTGTNASKIKTSQMSERQPNHQRRGVLIFVQQQLVECTNEDQHRDQGNGTYGEDAPTQSFGRARKVKVRSRDVDETEFCVRSEKR